MASAVKPTLKVKILHQQTIKETLPKTIVQSVPDAYAVEVAKAAFESLRDDVFCTNTDQWYHCDIMTNKWHLSTLSIILKGFVTLHAPSMDSMAHMQKQVTTELSRMFKDIARDPPVVSVPGVVILRKQLYNIKSGEVRCISRDDCVGNCGISINYVTSTPENAKDLDNGKKMYPVFYRCLKSMASRVLGECYWVEPRDVGDFLNIIRPASQSILVHEEASERPNSANVNVYTSRESPNTIQCNNCERMVVPEVLKMEYNERQHGLLWSYICDQLTRDLYVPTIPIPTSSLGRKMHTFREYEIEQWIKNFASDLTVMKNGKVNNPFAISVSMRELYEMFKQHIYRIENVASTAGKSLSIPDLERYIRKLEFETALLDEKEPNAEILNERRINADKLRTMRGARTRIKTRLGELFCGFESDFDWWFGEPLLAYFQERCPQVCKKGWDENSTVYISLESWQAKKQEHDKQLGTD